jgi:hypothetical protein
MSNQSTRINENHFSTEKFPEVIAFCDRDESTHIQTPTEESYEYALDGKARYMLKKYAEQWELVEKEDKSIVRVSTGRNLGMVLWQALRFSNVDRGKQDDFVNVLIPVLKTDVEKALALMYYYGGYPGNFLEKNPELEIIVDRFVDADLSFLSYSYVPVTHLEWLRETLKQNGILQEGVERSLWVYKK